MIFNQFEDGSCDIVFSEEEKKIIMNKGKLYLNSLSLRHFGNNLVKIVAELNKNFSEEISKIGTTDSSKMDGTDNDK